MKKSINIISLSLILFAAAILPCITAAYGLSDRLYYISAAVFLAANIFPAPFTALPTRYRIACGGGNLLCAFLILILPETVYCIAADVPQYGLFSSEFLRDGLILYFSELIIFWNGIIRVYLSSSMLGTRLRILGILCGLIPIVNIIVLLKIISVVHQETDREEQRLKLRKSRIGKNICRTKYPIVLVHGVFFRDSRLFNYWGRIPRELEDNGAVIFYGSQQSALNIKNSAVELMRRIKEILEETGSDKVNIIAHSKGGLDSRYAISCLGAAPYVASLTTINTPHRGCEFADWLLKNAPDVLKKTITEKYNAAFRLMGDSDPDFIGAVSDLTAESCRSFNEAVPDSPGVYYPSFGSKINRAMTSVFPLNFSHMLASRFEGENDGLVSVSSAQWGEKYTVLRSSDADGISHADIIDLFRHDKPDLDIREFYVKLVSDLREKGF